MQNTAVDLVDFRNEARQSYGSITCSIKRPSDPNGSVTVSPDTAGLRPPSKRALKSRRADLEAVAHSEVVYYSKVKVYVNGVVYT